MSFDIGEPKLNMDTDAFEVPIRYAVHDKNGPFGNYIVDIEAIAYIKHHDEPPKILDLDGNRLHFNDYRVLAKELEKEGIDRSFLYAWWGGE